MRLTTCGRQDPRVVAAMRRGDVGVVATRRAGIVLVVAQRRSIARAAETTLLDAAEQGDRAAALRLLAKGADPNATGPDGTTADHVGGVERRSRVGARADQGRRQRQR